MVWDWGFATPWAVDQPVKRQSRTDLAEKTKSGRLSTGVWRNENRGGDWRRTERSKQAATQWMWNCRRAKAELVKRQRVEKDEYPMW